MPITRHELRVKKSQSDSGGGMGAVRGKGAYQRGSTLMQLLSLRELQGERIDRYSGVCHD